MSLLTAVPAANGLLQVIDSGVTLWQTNAANPGEFTSGVNFEPVSGTGGFNNVASCQQENGTPQIWGNLDNGKCYTATNNAGSPGTNWTWKQITAPPQSPATFGAALGASGKVQIYAGSVNSNTNVTTLETFYQTVANEQTYTAWGSFSPSPGALSTGASALRHATTGVTQLFASTAALKLMTIWKTSAQASAEWGAWTAVSSQPDQPFYTVGAPRADGRIQLFALLEGGHLATTIQASSTTPSATFPAWTSVAMPSGEPILLDLAIARLPNGRIQLFIIATAAHSGSAVLYTCYQESTAANSAYTSWIRLTT